MFIDLHTHHAKIAADSITIQSLAVSESVFLAMPKTKPITIGIHPWYSKADEFDKNMKYLQVLAKQPNVLMIGECGLDKLKGEDLSFQIQVFEAQIKLAEQLAKPVIIHCVKAYDELIAITRKLKPRVPLIIHGFNKKLPLANQLVHEGFILSFGAAVLQSATVAEVVATINTPFFLETDDAEASIETIYEKVAELRKITVIELKDVIFAHWNALWAPVN